MDYSLWIAGAGIVIPTLITIIGTVWRQGLWISKQFTDLKDFVETKTTMVLSKLEYHEKHDDQRFGRVYDDIWMLRLALNGKNLRIQRQDSTFSTDKSRDVGREIFSPPES